MSDQQGFRVFGQFFPVPVGYQARDMALVKHVTEMSFKDWAKAMNDPDNADDPLLWAGAVAVAAWQTNRSWTKQQAYRWGTELDPNDVELVGFDIDEAEGDAVVPPSESGDPTSSGSPETSSDTPSSSPES